MQLAIVAAGFTPGEADRAAPRDGRLEAHAAASSTFRGQAARRAWRRAATREEFAQRIYQQMLGFGEYGFPESHAASFALLVYDSSWLKYHEPAAFTCALLNSQPMGFYAPGAAGARCARARGRGAAGRCAGQRSGTARSSAREDGEPALRLGLRLVKSLSEAGARRVVEAARRQRPVRERAGSCACAAALDRGDLEALAAAGALAALSGNRHLAFWEVAGTERALPLAPPAARAGEPKEGTAAAAQRRPKGRASSPTTPSVGLTLGPSSAGSAARTAARARLLTPRSCRQLPHGARVRAAGIVLMRQRPATAPAASPS